MVRRILAPVSSWLFAESAVRYAIELLGPVGGTLHLLYMVDRDALANIPPEIVRRYIREVSGDGAELAEVFGPEAKTEVIEHALRKHARSLLDHLAKVAASHKIEVIQQISLGEQCSAICEHAAEADLIAVGKRGAHLDTGLTILSQDLESLIRVTSCPILTVPPNHRPIHHVLLVLEDSPRTLDALALARDIAMALNAGLTLLATDTPNADAVLRQASDWLSGTHLQVTCLPSDANPQDRILHHANSGKYDLVILSAHSQPTAFLFGLPDSTLHILHGTQLPLILYP